MSLAGEGEFLPDSFPPVSSGLSDPAMKPPHPVKLSRTACRKVARNIVCAPHPVKPAQGILEGSDYVFISII
jgi:hypothetical protein